jgi:hypothetical protein
MPAAWSFSGGSVPRLGRASVVSRVLDRSSGERSGVDVEFLEGVMVLLLRTLSRGDISGGAIKKKIRC